MKKIFALFLCVLLLLSASAECFASTTNNFEYKVIKTDSSVLQAADRVSFKPYAVQSEKSAQYRAKYPLYNDKDIYANDTTEYKEFTSRNSDAGFVAFREKYFGEYYDRLDWCKVENKKANTTKVYLISPEEKNRIESFNALVMEGPSDEDYGSDGFFSKRNSALFFPGMKAYNNFSATSSLRDYVDNGNGYAQGLYNDYLFAKCFYETLNAVYPDLNETFTTLDKQFYEYVMGNLYEHQCGREEEFDGFMGYHSTGYMTDDYLIAEGRFYCFPVELTLLGLTEYFGAIDEGLVNAYGWNATFKQRDGYQNSGDYEYIGYPAFKDKKDLVIYNLYKGRFHVFHAPAGWHETKSFFAP